MSGNRELAVVADLLLPAPADPATSPPHALVLHKLHHGTQWQRVRAQLPKEELDRIGGLLRSFVPRASNVLLGLLAGKSGLGAAVVAGVTPGTTLHWRKSVPEYGDAYAFCAEMGFALVFESEIESRALAGDADRGSVRLLEMIAKSRGGDAYREKTEVTTRHLKGAEAAGDVFDAMKLDDGSFGVKPTP